MTWIPPGPTDTDGSSSRQAAPGSSASGAVALTRESNGSRGRRPVRNSARRSTPSGSANTYRTPFGRPSVPRVTRDPIASPRAAASRQVAPAASNRFTTSSAKAKRVRFRTSTACTRGSGSAHDSVARTRYPGSNSASVASTSPCPRRGTATGSYDRSAGGAGDSELGASPSPAEAPPTSGTPGVGSPRSEVVVSSGTGSSDGVVVGSSTGTNNRRSSSVSSTLNRPVSGMLRRRSRTGLTPASSGLGQGTYRSVWAVSTVACRSANGPRSPDG